MSYQQRLFDGYSVTHERGTISSFQIEDEDIKHFQADDVLVFVVTGTIAGASYKHDPSGDWVRTNKVVAHQVRVADGVMKEEIIEFYNLLGDQLPFTTRGGSPASSGPAGGASSGGSTHVQPSVASAGNNDNNLVDPSHPSPLDEDDEPDQDFSPPVSQVSPAAAPPRDPALASFLNEQSA